MKTKPLKYLTVALYHPRVMKGGAQYVAKDLHDMAVNDPEVDPVLLAGIDARMFPQYARVGSAISLLPDSQNEYILGGHKFDDFYHVVYDPRRNKMIARFLADHRPDVIHIHHSLWVGLEFIELCRRIVPDAKIIYTLHEYLPICYSQGQLFRYHEKAICRDDAPDQCVKCFPQRSVEEFILRKRAFRRAFDKIDHFISPSHYLRNRFVAWGIDPDRISVIANGHGISRPADWTPQHSKKLNIFGYFGQFVDAKGIDILLQAARSVAETTGEALEIKIFGGNKQHASPDYLERIERVMNDAPANLLVTEVGAYSRNNVFDLMNSVDWVVVPSVWPETFGLVVSEAWEARRPVLASRAGGLGERIIDGVNGISFPPGSSSSLAQIMSDCLSNEALWQKMATAMADEISMDTAWSMHRQLMQSISAESAGRTVTKIPVAKAG